MVLHLAEQLEVPLRERNQLLLAAGFAPAYRAAPARRARDGAGARRDRAGPARARAVSGARRRPALGRSSPRTARSARCSAGVAAQLLEPPVNVLRAQPPSGRPGAAHRQPRRVARPPARAPAPRGGHDGDPALARCTRSSRPIRRGEPAARLDPAFGDIAVPLRLRQGDDELAFISTKTTFGTAVDVTVAELSIESFFPADEQTARALRALAPSG